MLPYTFGFYSIIDSCFFSTHSLISQQRDLQNQSTYKLNKSIHSLQTQPQQHTISSNNDNSFPLKNSLPSNWTHTEIRTPQQYMPFQFSLALNHLIPVPAAVEPKDFSRSESVVFAKATSNERQPSILSQDLPNYHLDRQASLYRMNADFMDDKVSSRPATPLPIQDKLFPVPLSLSNSISLLDQMDVANAGAGRQQEPLPWKNSISPPASSNFFQTTGQRQSAQMSNINSAPLNLSSRFGELNVQATDLASISIRQIITPTPWKHPSHGKSQSYSGPHQLTHSQTLQISAKSATKFKQNLTSLEMKSSQSIRQPPTTDTGDFISFAPSLPPAPQTVTTPTFHVPQHSPSHASKTDLFSEYTFQETLNDSNTSRAVDISRNSFGGAGAPNGFIGVQDEIGTRAVDSGRHAQVLGELLDPLDSLSK